VVVTIFAVEVVWIWRKYVRWPVRISVSR